MGLFDFVKDAGEKLFGGGDDKTAVAERGLALLDADQEQFECAATTAGLLVNVSSWAR